jgi:hypothetical protein
MCGVRLNRSLSCSWALHFEIHFERCSLRAAFTVRSRLISTTVDEVYQAMRNNPGLPNKDDAASLPEFVQKLNTRLQARLSVQFGTKELHDGGSFSQPRGG